MGFATLVLVLHGGRRRRSLPRLHGSIPRAEMPPAAPHLPLARASPPRAQVYGPLLLPEHRPRRQQRLECGTTSLPALPPPLPLAPKLALAPHPASHRS